MLPVARNRAINLIAEDGLTENRAAAPRIELPFLIAATMRSRKSCDSGAGMTSPPTHQNRLPRISIPDSAQHKSALESELADPSAPRSRADHLCFITVCGDKPFRSGSACPIEPHA